MELGATLPSIVVTPSLEGVSQRKPVPWGYTDFRIHTQCPGESLLVTTGYASFVTAFCEDDGDGDGDGMGFPPTPIKTQKRRDYD